MADAERIIYGMSRRLICRPLLFCYGQILFRISLKVLTSSYLQMIQIFLQSTKMYKKCLQELTKKEQSNSYVKFISGLYLIGFY